MTNMTNDLMTDVDGSLLDDALLDRLVGQVQAEGLQLLGPQGVLTELTSRLLSKAMDAELTEHLGYERGDKAGWGTGNSRNGTSSKTVLTDAGAVPVDVPRDRNGTFEPKLIGKHQRRLDGFNDMVIGLVARGMSTRDVASHLAEVYGKDVSAEQISKITDAVLPELRAWQSRPLDAVYPIVYLDAIRKSKCAPSTWSPTGPSTWRWASMSRAASTFWACGWAKEARERSSGSGSAPSCATAG
jgi:hypothetical protein